jgi:hypothetical protein
MRPIGTLFALAVLVLVTGPAAAASRAKQCRKACGGAIAACAELNAAFGFGDVTRGCAKGILKRCRHEGTASCGAFCGNGIKDGNEACDAADLGGATCASLGFVSGTLACTATCDLSTAGCTPGSTLPAGNDVAGPDGAKAFLIPNACYSGKTVTANDSNLVSENVTSGVTILGVTGSYPLSGVPRTTRGLCPCSADVDDAQLRKGVLWPEPRFTDNGNGTVTDNLTSLIWLKNANCFNTQTWTQALGDANTLAAPMCGLSDGSTVGQWRLPNVRELLSLIDFGYASPALPPSLPFIGVQASVRYWSSTVVANNSVLNAWDIDFDIGTVNRNQPKTNTYYVWPVRGGQ